jgi:hypothetical protein
MVKRKRSVKSSEVQPAAASSSTRTPVKKPIPLAIGVILFALWFIFLLVTALSS